MLALITGALLVDHSDLIKLVIESNFFSLVNDNLDIGTRWRE